MNLQPDLSPTSELPQTGPTREHLRQARYHLDLTRELLDHSVPEYRAAAGHIAMCYQRALSAVTTWNRVRLSEGADVRELGHHAAHFASILRTPVGRALAILPRLRTVGSKEMLDVHDQEGVETGWYTARNLYRTVVGELPACVRAGHAAPAPAAVPPEPRTAGRRSDAGTATYNRQERVPTPAERASPAALTASL